MKALMLILAGCGAALGASGQAKEGGPAGEIAAATVERVVSVLAADSMEGRQAGHAGSVRAARFLAGEFRRIGLQPLAGGSYEQRFSAYEARPLHVRAEVGGQEVAGDRVVVQPGQESLEWVSGQTPDVEVVVVGPQDNARQAFGKVIEPTANVLLLVDTAHARTFGRMAAYLDRARLHAEQPGPFSAAAVLVAGPTAATACRVTATAKLQAVELLNVAGMLPGTGKGALAKENVVFSAHYDHLGYLKAVAGDSLANGADDDASGTSAVVALAEYFKARGDHARPLIFVAFTAEEAGGFGSRYFSRRLDPRQVVAMFNIEMIGKVAEGGPGTAYITGFDKSDFGSILQRGLSGTPYRFGPDPYPDQDLFYRSDNATLARLGVPAHTISTSKMPDALYHSVDDEVATLDLGNMTRVISAIARSSEEIVKGKATPKRIVDAGKRREK